jgi:uncharacterized membrane protein
MLSFLRFCLFYSLYGMIMNKHLWIILQILIGIVNAALIVVWLYSKGGFYLKASEQQAVGTPLDYNNFVPILLTAIGVMIAVLTVFLAIAAVWGYTQIKDETTKTAKETAKETAKVEARKLVPAEVGKVVPAEVELFMKKMSDGNEFRDYGRAEGEAHEQP